MIVTGDYSLLLDSKKDRSVATENVVPEISSLDLAVAHFVNDTADWTDESERTAGAEDLADFRVRTTSKQQVR